MQINFAELSSSERYHVMTQVVIPRPIAWVLTDSGASESVSAENTDPSRYNLAPYSYFTAISSEPPLVMISAGSKPAGEFAGELKDTRENLRTRKHGVIHIPSVDDVQLVTDTAATLAHGESEIVRSNLALEHEAGWALPRLKDCSVAMACEFYDEKEIGPNKQGVLFCEITQVYVAPHAVGSDDKGRVKIDAKAINPLSRLGANEYASFGDIVSLSRPK